MPRQKTIGEERRNTRLRIEHLRKGEKGRKGAEEQKSDRGRKRKGKVRRRVKGG